VDERGSASGAPTATAAQLDADGRRLAGLGYKPELNRVRTLFGNFSVAFCYLSPMVGSCSLFVLGVGSAGPRYLWLMPIVVAGQFLVALVFAELGSHYPIAGALFQWAKNTVGAGYGWWVGWIYGWALIITVAAVDTGIYLYGAPLLNSLFGTKFTPTPPNTTLGFTLSLLPLHTTSHFLPVRVPVPI